MRAYPHFPHLIFPASQVFRALRPFWKVMFVISFLRHRNQMSEGIVPNSCGQRGVRVAVALGIVGGVASRELNVLQEITKEHQDKMQVLLKEGFCSVKLAENVPNLYILIKAEGQGHSAEVEIRDKHNHITRIAKDGEVLIDINAEREGGKVSPDADRSALSLRSILEFADALRMEDAEPLLAPQIECNRKVAAEGLRGDWGARVGKTLLACGGETADITVRARAAAAAASDARMGGCTLPVVINSGSGNQGLTVTLPLLVYAEEYKVPTELLYRALAVSNLVAIHQKKYIGSLSAYCGATSAACGAACGIAYMLNTKTMEQEERYRLICGTVTNCICTIGGMVCDGAKSSCASKISAAVETALTAYSMSLAGNVFQPGEGLTKENTERTIEAVGRMGRVGMRATDVEILRILLEK